MRQVLQLSLELEKLELAFSSVHWHPHRSNVAVHLAHSYKRSIAGKKQRRWSGPKGRHHDRQLKTRAGLERRAVTFRCEHSATTIKHQCDNFFICRATKRDVVVFGVNAAQGSLTWTTQPRQQVFFFISGKINVFM